ncbi:MAG TPA: hypothetical protein VGD81_03750 [Opitutaceae bacterium]
MPLDPPADPPCRYFRTKRMYLPPSDMLDPYSPELAAPAYCWCNKTLTELGADEELAGEVACCRPGRPCYARWR